VSYIWFVEWLWTMNSEWNNAESWSRYCPSLRFIGISITLTKELSSNLHSSTRSALFLILIQHFIPLWSPLREEKMISELVHVVINCINWIMNVQWYSCYWMGRFASGTYYGTMFLCYDRCYDRILSCIIECQWYYYCIMVQCMNYLTPSFRLVPRTSISFRYGISRNASILSHCVIFDTSRT